jgi:chromosomal replication initiator protein
MNLKELWQNALGEIELSISRANFITWFRNTEIISKKNGVVIINVPNGFTKEWLENKYNKLILKTLRNICQDVKEIQFTIGGQYITSQPSTKQIREEMKVFPEKQLGLEEFTVDKETNLNPKYTFNNFVVGSFNELAQAAARAIIKHLGTLYNPLFIYGGVGLGKTHLLQALGNELVKKYPSKKIKYLSSEKYTSELVDAISKKGMESFKPKYRKIDVLIIDDIHFMAGKEKTQEEFFHTFNALYQKNKQIVITSDRPPKAISTLEERLRSRFEGGMIADISYPDLETRIAILKNKAKEKKFEISEEILHYIATNIQKNIRELEGALNRVIADYQITNIPPTLEKTTKILSHLISKPKKMTNFKDILKTIAEFYDININDLINKCRKKEVVRPRQIAMYLIREELNSSYPYIGDKLGGRDHTTVMYACEKINQEIKNNESFQQEINLIKERLYG